MTDASGTVPPFPDFPGFSGFPGFPSTDMLERMWDLMRATPFGGVLPGVASGAAPGLSMMSDMMAPLTSVEELDKRITDLRAVEQWLKLNLSMLQSAIQGLEVQRATLATLRAFGAYAQAQMTPPPDVPPDAPNARPEPAAERRPFAAASAEATKPAEERPPEPAAEREPEPAAVPPGFDASTWWNLLQTQFNQLAQFAMTPPAPVSEPAPARHAAAPKPAPRRAAPKAAAAKPAAQTAARRAARKPADAEASPSPSRRAKRPA